MQEALNDAKIQLFQMKDASGIDIIPELAMWNNLLKTGITTGEEESFIIH